MFTNIAAGGQYCYRHHRDMPDVFNAPFNYPERRFFLSCDVSLNNDIYQQTPFLGSEATMDVDRFLFNLHENTTSTKE